jgi:ATP-dependent exoDNAse (exonuclease V) beta subunit
VLSSELLKNYRSHPDILSVFNRLFYSNRLESAAEFDKLTLVSCSFQRNKTFPLVFIDVPPHGGPSSAYVTGIQVANTEELANVSAAAAAGRRRDGVVRGSRRHRAHHNTILFTRSRLA